MYEKISKRQTSSHIRRGQVEMLSVPVAAPFVDSKPAVYSSL